MTQTSQQSTAKSVQSTLSLVNYSPKKAKLIITPLVEQQIKWLCNKISTVEWSGVLFHSSEGDINDPETFICKAEYILLLDKGSSAYTDYDFSSDLFTNAIAEKPELLDYSMSHIHSHNSMSVFFSGTDNEELTDNVRNYNYYLSLIVNNKYELCARVAFLGEIGGRNISFKGKDGKLFELTTEKTECCFYHEMDVVSEKGEVDEFFVKQYDAVLKDAYKPKGNWPQHDYSGNGQFPINFEKGDKKSKKGFNNNNSTKFFDMPAVEFIKEMFFPDVSVNKGLIEMAAAVDTSKEGLKKWANKVEKVVDDLAMNPGTYDAWIKRKKFVPSIINPHDEPDLAEMINRVTDLIQDEPMFKNLTALEVIVEYIDKWTWY